MASSIFTLILLFLNIFFFSENVHGCWITDTFGSNEALSDLMQYEFWNHFLVIFAFWPLEWRILSCVSHLLHYIIRLGPNYVQVIRFCTKKKKKENSWVFTTGWKLKYDLITLTIIGPILFILVFIFNVGDTSLENVSGNC